MKLLMTTYGWTQTGGGTEFPRTIAKSLAKNNLEVTVVAAEALHPEIHNPYFVEESYDDGVKLLKIFNCPSVFLDAENPRREILDENIYTIFTKIFEEEKPDIAHFHNFLGLSFAISDIPKKNNVPTLFTAHNFHLLDPELYMFDYNDTLSTWKTINLLENSTLIRKNPHLKTDYKIRQEIARKVLRENIDVFIAISQKYAQIYNEFADIYNKIVVINQISDICDKSIPSSRQFSGKLQIGYFGSIYPHKGIHTIYQAAELLKELDIEFFLFGSGSIEYLSKLINQFPNVKVKYQGPYTRNQMRELSKNLDCAIISSIVEEGGPLVAPELLSLGLPIIGANIGGIPDFVIDGFNGKLFQANNPANLADTVKFIFHNTKELTKMQVNSYTPFTYDDYIYNLMELYNDLVYNRSNFQPKKYQLLFSSKLINQASETLTNQIDQETFDEQDLLELIDRDLAQEIKKNDQLTKDDNSNPFRPIMLNLASQGEVIPGFINIDKNPRTELEINGDIRNLKFKDDSVEIIVAKNILQVFSHREFPRILLEWKRVLKIGGTIIISVPDLKSILEAYVNNKLNIDEIQNAIFGHQANEFDYFYNGFDEKSIVTALEQSGFKVIELNKIYLNSTKYYDLLIRAIKA